MQVMAMASLLPTILSTMPSDIMQCITDLESVKRSPTMQVMAMASLLPTILSTMPSDMACTITDTERGRRLIGTSREGRCRRIGATVPGIITTVEEAKGLQTPSTSAQPGKISSWWCNVSSSKYLARCGGGSISANKQIE